MLQRLPGCPRSKFSISSGIPTTECCLLHKKYKFIKNKWILFHFLNKYVSLKKATSGIPFGIQRLPASKLENCDTYENFTRNLFCRELKIMNFGPKILKFGVVEAEILKKTRKKEFSFFFFKVFSISQLLLQQISKFLSQNW